MSYFIDEKTNTPKIGNIIKLLIGVIIFFSVIVPILFGTWGTVSAGSKGVKTQFGAAIGELSPGLYFKLPYVQDVVTMDVQTQKEQVDNASAASSDLQTVTTNIAVNYNLEPDKVVDVYSRIGLDYKSKIIDPAIQETLKAITANYTAEELITKRDTVTADIKALLAQKLQPNDINVTAVSITNFDFSKTFNDAIEAKVTAQQNALAAQNKLQQVQFEAQQTITSAKAQAEAIAIQAQAINSQGGADYVQLQAIKAWDGHLPTSMIPGGAVPFINLTK